MSTDLTTARKQVLESLIKPKQNNTNEIEAVLQIQLTRNFAKRMFRHGLHNPLIFQNEAFAAQGRRLSRLRWNERRKCGRAKNNLIFYGEARAAPEYFDENLFDKLGAGCAGWSAESLT